MEYSNSGTFDDRVTLSVINRDLGKVSCSWKNTDDSVYIETEHLRLKYNGNKPFNAGNLQIEGTTKSFKEKWFPGKKDRGNLKGTLRTLDGMNGFMRNWAKKRVHLPDGLLSKNGWSIVDDSTTIARKKDGWIAGRPSDDYVDLYFFGYGRDYTSCLQDAGKLFGMPSLVPRYCLGYWYSRYWAYTDREIESIVDILDKLGVPLDVFVIDMDWHLLGWTGYTVDKSMLVNHKELFSHLKKRDLKLTLNLHPADGVGKHEKQYADMVKATNANTEDSTPIPFDCTDKKYMQAYFKYLHTPLEKDGVDFWWIDWQQGADTKFPGLDPLPWLNTLHYEDLNRKYKNKRPLIFSRFGGIGSGRYPVGFSGDTVISWKSLQIQPYFTATASNILYGFWSHDIGGHMLPEDTSGELYLRWLQYGIYSPIFRTHSSKGSLERRFWEYPEPYKWLFVDCVKKRYELVPYIYTELVKSTHTGKSLCSPMYYEHPEEEQSYTFKDQYYFGDHMLISPVLSKISDKTGTAKKKTWLPKGYWYDLAHGISYRGNTVVEQEYLEKEVPVFIKKGTIIPGLSNATRITPKANTNLLFNIYTGASGNYSLYEDDGITPDGPSIYIHATYNETKNKCVFTINPVKGNYKGMPKKRNIELQLHFSPPIKRALAGSKSLSFTYRLQQDGWNYDCFNNKNVLRVSNIDLKKGLKVTVEFPEALHKKNANGLRGLFSRLWEIGELTGEASPVFSFFKDERYAIHFAQMPSRVNHAPSTFFEEIKRIPDMLEKLVTTQKRFISAYKKKKPNAHKNIELLQESYKRSKHLQAWWHTA
jgi:alpha-glucosidase (family GH31 glycosyl hydrolase)